MFIGFGFGSPLTALLMLLITGAGSYFLFRALRRHRKNAVSREQRRCYFYEQRETARRMSKKYDLSDEEIERRLDEEYQPRQ
ncbi:MAG: DUF4229 domain-containing protein [Peptococcaceae bacterium]|nr:DUF4229 domain-containing protein [Peptococcaceae bacterium]